MKKAKKIFFLLSLLCCLDFSFKTSAHPGSTDAYGGHYDHSDGSYHYHHGYPAHNHDGGICPYQYNDQTRTTSGASSVYKPRKKNNSVKKEVVERYTYEKYGSYWVYISNGYFHLYTCPEFPDSYSAALLNEVETNIKPCNYCDPLKINTLPKEKEPESLLKQTKEWIKDNIENLYYVFLAFIVILCIISAIKGKKKEKIEGREYKYYFSYYAFYSPESFCEIPSGTFTKGGIPYTDGDDKYGEYTVYISEKGNCYHRRKSCLRNGYGSVQNMAFVYKTYRPCARCCKKAIDISWYEEYKRIYDIKKKYMIP